MAFRSYLLVSSTALSVMAGAEIERLSSIWFGGLEWMEMFPG